PRLKVFVDLVGDVVDREHGDGAGDIVDPGDREAVGRDHDLRVVDALDEVRLPCGDRGEPPVAVAEEDEVGLPPDEGRDVDFVDAAGAAGDRTPEEPQGDFLVPKIPPEHVQPRQR